MRLSEFVYTQRLDESINDKGIFKAVFMAGHSGAGKSYVLSKVRSGSIEPRIVNVDKYVEFFIQSLSFLGKVDAYEGYYWARAKTLTVNQIANYLDSMLPLAVDVTAANPKAVTRRHSISKECGYDTAMVFVKCSLETALARAKSRERKVPEEVVTRYYEEIQRIKPYLKSKFTPFIEVSNDVGELTDEVILDVFRRVEGFYNAPIENPIGKEFYEKMKENNWKYLSDGIFTKAEIQEKAVRWYKR